MRVWRGMAALALTAVAAAGAQWALKFAPDFILDFLK